MKERLTDIKVGFFVFLGVLLMCMMILLVGSDKLFFQSEYTLFCKFQNILGLQKGASVRLAGYNVGTVKNIFFSQEPGEKKYVIVELALEVSKREYIRADSKASINSLGVLGDKYIEVSFGSPKEPMIEPNGWLISESSKELTDYLSKAGSILQKVDNIISFIDEKLENYKKTGKTTNIFDDLAVITNNIAQVTTEIRQGKGILNSLIYDEKTNEHFKTTLTEFADMSKEMKQISWKINRGKGTLGALVNDDTLYEDLKTILSGASRSKTFKYLVRYSIKKAEEIERNPSSKEESNDD